MRPDRFAAMKRVQPVLPARPLQVLPPAERAASRPEMELPVQEPAVQERPVTEPPR